MLSDDLLEVRSRFKEEIKKKRELPVIIATTLNDFASAKTHRGRVVGMLSSDGHDNVIGVFGDRQILSVLSSETVLDNLEDNFQKEEAAVLTSSLNGIEVFRPIVDAYENNHIEYRARLIDYNDFDQNNLARMHFESYCKLIGVQIKKKYVLLPTCLFIVLR